MTLGELIGPAQVIEGLRVGTKAQLLTELSRRAAAAVKLDQPLIQDALQQREELGSTGLGKGFALPHARLPGLSKPFAMFARLSKPIDFAAVDDRPVDIVVLLLTPTNGASDHLSTLAAISRPMREEAFTRRLREAANGPALHAVLAAA